MFSWNSCFFDDPTDISNLISGSSAFFKTSLNIHWIIEKAREFQKNYYFCFIDYAKAFDCVDHNKLWKILKEMGIPDRLIASWEICMQVRKQQLEVDME